ncbi:PD40 domain-containing protein, partial [Candidatus Curtissbacteria bacterium]|nr:PD40 domain-containing protein [Candidatus Curtissbacteria bacterium]
MLIASFLALSREETAFSDPTVAVGTWVEVFGLDQNNLSDYLNVRDTTSLSGKENHHLYNDYVAYIDEGPVEAEGYRWWHLAGLGWAVDNWLRATSEEKIPKEPKGKILFVQHDSNSNTFWNLINSDGTNKENLMVFPFEACGPLDYAWAPDGKEVAFVTCEGTDENPTYLINKLNIETGEIVILISIDNEHPKSLSWSPDDKAIVFSLSNKEDSDYYSSGYEPRIYFLDLETLEVVEVPDTKGRFPDWSADGRKIVFSSGGDLFLVNKDGTGLTNLGVNPSGWASTPSWSPTGDKIVFTCNDVRRPYRYLDGTYICEVFADGTGLNKIVSDQTNL